MHKIKFFISLFLSATFLYFMYLYFEKRQERKDFFDYLPLLKKYDLKDIKFKKIYADPSYTIPYNVLISFKTEAQNIIEDLGLKEKEKIDTSQLKSHIWITKYKIYFSLSNVNALRYPGMGKEEKTTKWWHVTDCSKVYASPYIDNTTNKRIVKFGEKNNGRIACCKSGNIYYILIECWE